MKKLSIILAAVILLAVYWGFLIVLGLPLAAPASTERIAATAEELERGDYLFNNVLGCPVCHSERNFDLFGGPPVPPYGGGRECFAAGQQAPGMANAGGMPGTICFRNISSDEATGIGNWTDGEVLRALREGIDHEGNGLFPIMPYFIYRHLADADARAVVAYVRTLPPVNNPQPETDINFPLSLFIQLAPEPVYAPVPQPDVTDPVAYGEYLSTVARCIFCHTPRNPRTYAPLPGKDFVGGVEFQGREDTFFSTNLTRHPDGLGDMQLDEFIELFRRPPEPATEELNVMPWTYFSGMTDADLGALFAYLQTVPAQATPPKGEK